MIGRVKRFTMDENLSKAVTNVFVTLYEEGTIYRGARIVNWCPNDKTVLSDLEVEDKEKKDGKLYYLQYPIKESDKKLPLRPLDPKRCSAIRLLRLIPNDERL